MGECGGCTNLLARCQEVMNELQQRTGSHAKTPSLVALLLEHANAGYCCLAIAVNVQ
jgi:hypothetical protein